MSGWWIAAAIIGAAIVGLLAYWQLIIAEGVYLGQKTVTLLYDRVAHKYNSIKAFDELDDPVWLGAPLARALGYNFRGIVLDVATGTGRLSAAMNQVPYFKGQVIGVDHSVKMLAIANQAVPDTPLVVADAMRLPFAAGSVGAVTCLEALEFFPDAQKSLREMTRVLATDGFLLTTNRIGWETRLMPGKTFTSDRLKAMLAQLPLTNIFTTPWLDIYEQVWARKIDSPEV